jgi:hypothetical protein
MMTIPFDLMLLNMKLKRWNPTVRWSITKFLTTLWEYDNSAYTFIGTRIGDRWQDHPITGNRCKRIEEILAAYSPRQYDIYFCPNAFRKPMRRKQYALPTRYAWCDIDDADLNRYDPQPNVLWRTSPGRHQGLWVWPDRAPGEIAEQYSRNIVYKDGGDTGGWSVTKFLRLPGTINRKPVYDLPHVQLLRFEADPQKLPSRLSKHVPTKSSCKVQIDLSGIDAARVIKKYRATIGLQARILVTGDRMTHRDRSAAIYMIVLAFIKAGATDSEIAAVLLSNIYFLDKHGLDQDTAEQEIGRIRSKVEAGQ